LHRGGGPRVLFSPSSLSFTRTYPRLGAPDYFELSKIVEGLTGLHIYLKEKNQPPSEYNDQKLVSKGFLPEIYIQDFPIRNQKVTLCIKCCRWEVKDTGDIVSRDWNLVQQGDGDAQPRIANEFVDFLKPGRRADLY
jgi:hypothetical protein